METKQILVTVAEFIENGGKMYNGTGKRKLFYQNGFEVTIWDNELYQTIIETQANDYYVKIPVTPLYE